MRTGDSTAGRRYQPAPKLVLLACDDDQLLAELVLALAKDQHHVVQLEDGLELLDYLDRTGANGLTALPRPDAIIASLGMPGPNGLALLEALRERDRRTPVIGLAEPGDAGCFSRARSLGALYIFESPFSPDDLREALHSLPGGAFPEAKASHDARLAACLRGLHFLHAGSKR